MPAYGTSDVQIPLPSGATLTAALALPDAAESGDAGSAGRPGMIVLHELYGLNDDMRRISARFADNGYVTVAPDLYSSGNRALCLSRAMLDMASTSARGT